MDEARGADQGTDQFAQAGADFFKQYLAMMSGAARSGGFANDTVSGSENDFSRDFETLFKRLAADAGAQSLAGVAAPAFGATVMAGARYYAKMLELQSSCLLEMSRSTAPLGAPNAAGSDRQRELIEVMRKYLREFSELSAREMRLLELQLDAILVTAGTQSDAQAPRTPKRRAKVKP